MGKAAVMTPFYISIAWTLMVSYQFFTQATVTTVITYVDILWPSLGAWLGSRMDIIVFIHSFAWVFLLSSAIPSFILGKERGVLVQFLVCLTLTFLAFIVQDFIGIYGSGLMDQIFGLASLFHNPILAMGYLVMPYLLMLGFDIHSRRKRMPEKMEDLAAVYLEKTAAEEEPQEEGITLN